MLKDEAGGGEDRRRPFRIIRLAAFFPFAFFHADRSWLQDA
jgi:hypothetical protein